MPESNAAQVLDPVAALEDALVHLAFADRLLRRSARPLRERPLTPARTRRALRRAVEALDRAERVRAELEYIADRLQLRATEESRSPR